MDCIICGKEFDQRNSLHKTCSSTCSKKLHKLSIKKYRNSHKEYFQNYGKKYREANKKILAQKEREYCHIHKKEIQQRRKKRYYEKRLKKFCVVCGKEIKKYRGPRKTCSVNCHKIRKAEYGKAWRNKHKSYKLRYCILCNKEILKGTNNSKFCKECSKLGTGKLTKLLVIRHYGNKCNQCGETHSEFLCIDHIAGGGNKHRKELKKLGSTFYRWLIKNNYPEEFQLLCYNCNRIKEIKSPYKISENRKNILIHYSGNPPKCQCCGESRIEVLEIDHIKGRKKKERLWFKDLYRFILDNNFPKNFQILCGNCNQTKSHAGNNQRFCPVHHPELYK